MFVKLHHSPVRLKVKQKISLNEQSVLKFYTQNSGGTLIINSSINTKIILIIK